MSIDKLVKDAPGEGVIQRFYNSLRKAAYVGIASAGIFAMSQGDLKRADAKDVTLGWDANPSVQVIKNENDEDIEYRLAGYKVHYGPLSRTYGGSGVAEGRSPIKVPLGDFSNQNQPMFTVSGISDPGTIYFAVSAYYQNGYETGYSNEVFDPPLNADDAAYVTQPPVINSSQIYFGLDSRSLEIIAPTDGSVTSAQVVLSPGVVLDMQQTNLYDWQLSRPDHLMALLRLQPDLGASLRFTNSMGTTIENLALKYDSIYGRKVTPVDTTMINPMDDPGILLNPWPAVFNVTQPEQGKIRVDFTYNPSVSPERYVWQYVPSSQKNWSNASHVVLKNLKADKFARLGVMVRNSGVYVANPVEYIQLVPGTHDYVKDISHWNRSNIDRMYLKFDGREGYNYTLTLDSIELANSTDIEPSMMVWKPIESYDVVSNKWINPYPGLFTIAGAPPEIEGTGSMDFKYDASKRAGYSDWRYVYVPVTGDNQDWRGFDVLRTWIGTADSFALYPMVRKAGIREYTPFAVLNPSLGGRYYDSDVRSAPDFVDNLYWKVKHQPTSWEARFDDNVLVDTQEFAPENVVFSQDDQEAVILD